MDVDYPGFGTIVIDGSRFDHDVVIEGGVVRPRDKGPSKDLKGRFGHTPLTAAEEIPWSKPQLVIGSGYSGRLPIDPDIEVAAAGHGVELIVVPTAEACSLLRARTASDVNAILHVTC